MLKSDKELSRRYVGQNKKHTVLTLFGIILSMALISTIGLFIKGAGMSQIQRAKEVSGLGAHLVFQNPDDEIYTKIANNPNIVSFGWMKKGNVSSQGEISFQKYIIDANAGELLKYGLKEGRMPDAEKEVCIDEWAKIYLGTDLVLGDIVELDGESYAITGFLKNQLNNQQAKICRAVVFDPGLHDGQLMAEIRGGRMFGVTLDVLKGFAAPEDIAENNELIRIQQLGTNGTLLAAGGIVVGIVIISTIIVIYNAFQINLTERTRQFGLLRSIGATKKQIRSLVLREATWMWLIAVPAGAALSIAAIYILQWVLRSVMTQNQILSIVCIDPRILLAASVLTIASVYASGYVPARHVGNISPLAAVNYSTMIKKEDIRKSSFRRAAKYLNFKAGMALKNIRRNPGRCMVMILSIVVSVTLFITFSMLTGEVMGISNASAVYQNLDLEISLNEERWRNVSRQDYLEQIVKELPGDRIYLTYPAIEGRTAVPENKQIKAAGKIYERASDSDQGILYAKINFYDESVISVAEHRLISGTAEAASMSRENGVILIQNGSARELETRKRYVGKLSDYKVNDSVVITDTQGNSYSVKIVGIIEDNLLDRNDNTNTLTFLSVNTVLENLTGEKADFIRIGIDLEDMGKHFDALWKIDRISAGYPAVSVMDYIDLNDAEKDSMLVIRILVYGIILVITLISTVNIINTVTMNITLRRKELAVLKSIGMAQRDLKKMIMYEGVFYGLIGGLLGVGSGSIFTYIIYDVLSESIGLEWRFPLGLSITAVTVSVLVGLLAAMLPLKKIGKDNVIEAIRMG